MNVLLVLATVFAVMVVLIRLRVPVGYVLAAGALLLCLLSRLGPAEIGRAFLEGVSSLASGGLLAAVLLVTIFGEVLRRVENLAALVAALRGYLRDVRLVLATAPAVIGLLPMPGGAMLSAPLVRQAADDMALPPEKLTMLNYWFRHVWEYCWPLYPGIIAAAAILGVPWWKLMVVHLPMSLVAMAVGFVVVMRRVPSSADAGSPRGSPRALLAALVPVSSVIALAMLLKIARLDDPWNLIAALAVLIPASAFMLGMRARGLLGAVVTACRPNLVALVLGLMVFKRCIEVTGAADAVPEALAALGVPQIVVIGLLPFICGLLTGITVGYVSVAYPILAAMIVTPAGVDFGLAMLAFGTGYVGVLLSPVHLCLILSKDYFEANLGLVYRALVVPCAAVVAVCLVLPALGWGGWWSP